MLFVSTQISEISQFHRKSPALHMDYFMGCTNLRSITIHDDAISIESFAFYYCTSLQMIKIPPKVTSISDYFFNRCTNLSSIQIHNDVKTIGSSAFRYCISLGNFTFPSTFYDRQG